MTAAPDEAAGASAELVAEPPFDIYDLWVTYPEQAQKQVEALTRDMIGIPDCPVGDCPVGA
ncbi:MAG: hypothetical protein M3171_10070 [Actinomycetota bacterium]|nr:hypothetical protein [Actinomycetota bacterium]